MEKKQTVIGSVLIIGISVLIVYLFSVSTSPLYRFVCTEKDVWCYLLGRMGAAGCVLYKDYSDTIGPACSIIFAILSSTGDRNFFFLAESIVLCLSLFLCFRIFILRRMNRNELFWGILFAICLYIAISNHCGITDRFFGVLTEMVLCWFLHETSMPAKPAAVKAGMVFIGVCFVIGFFSRFDPALILLMLLIIVRNKKNVKYLFYGTSPVMILMIMGILFVAPADVTHMFDWWIKIQMVEFRLWVVWLFPCGIYMYTLFVEYVERVIILSESTTYGKVIRKFIPFSIVMVAVGIFCLKETLNAGDRNLSYLAGGYEEERYDAFLKMCEMIPEEERGEIIGLSDTAGFFVTNQLIPVNKPYLNRSVLYEFIPRFDTEAVYTVSDKQYQWVVCSIKQGESEAEVRSILRDYYEVALVSHGYQLWERKK